MNEVGELFWAYLAGFADGEGCFRVYTRGPGLTLAQKDPYVLEYIKLELELDLKLTKSGAVYYLQINRQDVLIRIIEHILPYMLVKNKDAQVVLDWCKARQVARGLA